MVSEDEAVSLVQRVLQTDTTNPPDNELGALQSGPTPRVLFLQAPPFLPTVAPSLIAAERDSFLRPGPSRCRSLGCKRHARWLIAPEVE